MTSSKARLASSWLGLPGLLRVVAGEMGECCCVLRGGRLCVAADTLEVGVVVASDALDAVCCCKTDADAADDLVAATTDGRSGGNSACGWADN